MRCRPRWRKRRRLDICNCCEGSSHATPFGYNTCGRIEATHAEYSYQAKMCPFVSQSYDCIVLEMCIRETSQKHLEELDIQFDL